MGQEKRRNYLMVGVAVVLFSLYQLWIVEHAPKQDNAKAESSKHIHSDISDSKPQVDVPNVYVESHTEQTVKSFNHLKEELIKVETDVLRIWINLNGGDVVKAELKKYPKTIKNSKPFELLSNNSDSVFHVAQSGLVGLAGMDSNEGRAIYSASSKSYSLSSGQEQIEVLLKAQNASVFKKYILRRGDYAIDVSYDIYNKQKQEKSVKMYGRLKREAAKRGSKMPGTHTFTGAALRTEDKLYKKVEFKNIKKKPLTANLSGGWVAMVQHYFLSSWIPDASYDATMNTESFGKDIYGIRFVSEAIKIPANQKNTIKAKLYLGPEKANYLKPLAKGLELTVDYGVLWVVCQPILWLLKKSFALTGNWGVAIILTTFAIKALFYRLSASSYRSMGKMRLLQPKMNALKEQYGDDRQLFGQKMMELYRTEKVNPMGGCLPILVQIPVFIALYWVLLGSIELRQASFVGWLQDLSSPDPYYILPIIMGATMLVQQKLSPAPPDPVQAKVMMLMPVVFTVMFVNAPAGLALYWSVNGILSIIQQWLITKSVNK